MQFENSFDVPLPPAEAWKVLLDVPRIAPCLPGAELTETLGPDKYKGRAGVKIGPVHLFFAGEAEIVARDEAARKATIKGKGNDTKGRGQAAATVDFALVDHNGGTRVNVDDRPQHDRHGRPVRPRVRPDEGDRRRDHGPVRGKPAQGDRADASGAGSSGRAHRRSFCLRTCFPSGPGRSGLGILNPVDRAEVVVRRPARAQALSCMGLGDLEFYRFRV